MLDDERISNNQPQKSLSFEIHAATRSYHTSLNRLVTARLPLCLPPSTQDATVYAAGIGAFAEIFFAFEHEWTSRVSTSDPMYSDVNPRILELLRTLYVPSLLRTTRLQDDLSLLSSQYHKPDLDQFDGLTSPAVPSQIRASIQAHPHVLFAYTWIMYLALFNGGRWIRSQLISTTTGSSTSPSLPKFWPDSHLARDCLSFWHFDGDQDGEDIKEDFKLRFEKAASRLTDWERLDVIEEAVRLFEICEGIIVQDLDAKFTMEVKPTTEKERPALPPSALQSPNPLDLQTLFSTLAHQLSVILTWVWALLSGSASSALPDSSNSSDGLFTRLDLKRRRRRP